MVISQIADGIWRQIDAVQDTVSETFFEPVIRLGVTGLARSGKTVFITSLVANLMYWGRMPALVAAGEGRIEAAFLQPQPDDTIPRFEYEAHLAALTAKSPSWPDSTRAVSEPRLSLRVRPNGLLSGLQGPRTIHLDIVDVTDLDGLTRVFSLLVLGLALEALAWLNRWAQERDRKDAPRPPPVPD